MACPVAKTPGAVGDRVWLLPHPYAQSARRKATVLGYSLVVFNFTTLAWCKSINASRNIYKKGTKYMNPKSVIWWGASIRSPLFIRFFPVYIRLKQREARRTPCHNLLGIQISRNELQKEMVTLKWWIFWMGWIGKARWLLISITRQPWKGSRTPLVQLL